MTGTVAGFFRDEWARFWAGWDNLSPEAQARARAEALAAQGAGATGATVSLPGWDSAVHVGPRYEPTPAERREYLDALREGRTPRISGEAAAEIARRRDSANRIRSSAQPGYAQAFGQMLTAIDNVQDFVTTVATLGRVALWPTLGALGRVAPGLAGKLGARLIPGIGWVLLVGDLLNLLAWLGTLAMVGYAGACHGPRAGAAAALGPLALRGVAGVRPCGVKGAMQGLADLNPFSRSARAARRLRAGRALPSIGNLLEVAQTTDQLFGIGVSFGGIVGAFMEGAYGAELAARGEKVNVLVPQGALGALGVGAGLAALQFKSGALGALAAGAYLADRLGATATAPLREKYKAAGVMVNAPAMLGTQETLTEREHVEQLVAYVHALDLVAADLDGRPWFEDVVGAAHGFVTPHTHFDAVSFGLLSQLPEGLDTLGRWPLPGAPAMLSGAELVDAFAPRIARALADFLAPRRESAVGMFYGGLANHVTLKLWEFMEGDPYALRWSLTPEFAWLMSLAESNRAVDVTEDEQGIWDFYHEGVEALREGKYRTLTPDQLDRQAARHGLALFHYEQPFIRESPDLEPPRTPEAP